MTRRTWLHHPALPWMILVGSLFIGVAGIRVIPPDAHEVYVLRTAQEMHERGDWIVPYYQGELRLEKPPLSYWLTGFTAWLSGQSNDVQPWHGRVPSVLGGLILIGCTLVMGRRLFDVASANLGGIVAATSLAFITYTHSARPDMLYAGCCAMVMLGLVMGYRGDSDQGTARPWGGLAWMSFAWVGFALATLAKGPHVPGMIVGGFAIWAMLNSEHRWRTLGRGLMWTVIGGVVVVLLAGWWWWAIKLRLGASTLEHSALGGGGYEMKWSRVLSVYYPVQLVKLFITWVMLIPAGIALLLHRRGRGANGAHLIGWWVLVALAVFWGAGHRRDYYLLPFTGAVALLLAAGTWRFIRIWHKQRWLRTWGTWYAAGLTVVLIVGGAGGYFWSSRRFTAMDFAQQVARLAPRDQLLVGLGTHADLSGYAANRNIAYCANVEQLQALVRRKNVTELSVVTRPPFLKKLADWSPRTLGQLVDDDSSRAMVLVRLTRPENPPNFGVGKNDATVLATRPPLSTAPRGLDCWAANAMLFQPHGCLGNRRGSVGVLASFKNSTDTRTTRPPALLEHRILADASENPGHLDPA